MTTVKTNSKLGAICRICLKADGPMSSIFTTSETESEYQPTFAARITSIAQVQIQRGDGLPIFVCQSCRQQVDNFYDFRLLVEISDRTLRSYVNGTQNHQRNSRRPGDDAKDLDYQEYLTENNSDDSKDLYGVNTILVPSVNDAQLWRICNVEGDNDEEKEEPKTMELRTISSPKFDYTRKIINSDIDHSEGVQRCLKNEKIQPISIVKNVQDISNLEQVKRTLKSKKVQPFAIVNNVREKEKLYFATKTNSCDGKKVSNETNQLTCITIVTEEDNDNMEQKFLPLKKYSCQLCSKPFKTLKTLKYHVKDHFLGGKERIQICEIQQKNVRLIRQARNSNRKSMEKRVNESSEEQNVNSLSRQSCEQVFEINEEKSVCANATMDNELKSGKTIETTIEKSYDSSLTCAECNKKFRNPQSFRMHLKRHTLGSRFNCRDCPKSYYSNSELARHMQLHTGMRQYPCHLCDMSFFSKPELNRHLKYHNGDKKFRCNVCSKTYYESGHLKVHARVHTGERPFVCTICEKGFITNSKLLRHIKIHERDLGA